MESAAALPFRTELIHPVLAVRLKSVCDEVMRTKGMVPVRVVDYGSEEMGKHQAAASHVGECPQRYVDAQG